jgi:hypothetical protein
MDSTTIISTVLIFLAALVLMALVFAFPIMWLWNWLMPVIFGLPTIGIWQAVGLYFLSGLLIKSAPSGK